MLRCDRFILRAVAELDERNRKPQSQTTKVCLWQNVKDAVPQDFRCVTGTLMCSWLLYLLIWSENPYVELLLCH